jgi:3'-phosphoadenosine 5'-phosphosulfate sulfotransferase (PAPS reductase)/FAD synthetase
MPLPTPRPPVRAGGLVAIDAGQSPAETRSALLASDRIVVAFSGGKDSLACLLHLLEHGVPPERIELHHHDVDGGGPTFMDWPCTPAYCAAIARYFGVTLYRSWRAGGFLGEFNRQAAPTAEVLFELAGGGVGRAGGRGPAGTRGRFPQVTADLKLRWCSSALKIEVLAAAIHGQARFLEGRTLVITGERAEESPARAQYASFEPHRTATRGGRQAPRRVDHWRPIHAWSEAQVWALIGRFRILPHPAYRLGWGRLSCRTCIFGSADQWATIRAVFPGVFEQIAQREALSGFTIQRQLSVRELAARGRPYPAALSQPALVAQAGGATWGGPVRQDPWELPAEAFGEAAGPT